jgi:hypothetical protein
MERSLTMKRHFGYVMAPKIAVDEKKKIRFMYREEPDNNQDSGWRFFSGDEDQDYVDNPDNLGIYDVNTIIKIDPDIEEYLDGDYGVAYERNDINSKFVLSKGPGFEEK